MSDPADNSIAPLARRNADPPRFGLFSQLRELWKAAGQPGEPPRQYAQLATLLEVPKQAISNWATGSGDKQNPPWWVIMRLCAELDYGVMMDPVDGLALYNRKQPESTATT